MTATHVVSLFLTLLSTTTKTEDQVKGGLLLDVVVAEGAAVLELLAGEDQALLVGRDAFLVCDKSVSDALEHEKVRQATYPGSWT